MALRLQLADQPDRLGNPGRVGNHLLPRTGLQREDMQLAGFAAQEPAEQEPAAGARYKDIKVERRGIGIGLQLLQPQLVAAPIFARRDGDAQARPSSRRYWGP